MLINPPTWTQNGTYTAEQDRRLIGAIVRREGVAGASSMVPSVIPNTRQVSIGEGGAYINGDYGDDGGGGMYFTYNEGATQVAIPASESLPRYDLIVIRVYDSAVSGSVNAAQFDVVRGTPATSPRIPATPRSAINVAAVLSPARSTSLQTNSLSDQRTFAQFHGGVLGSVPSTQRNMLNQQATTTNPILITPRETPNRLEMSTGSGFQGIGGMSIVDSSSSLPPTAADGTIVATGNGRMYHRRDNKWKFFNGWGPYITLGRATTRSYSGQYVGGLVLNGPSNANWGDEEPISSGDYSQHFSVIKGRDLQSNNTASQAGGVSFKTPGRYSVTTKYKVTGLRNNTAVRSRIDGLGLRGFTTMENQEGYGFVDEGKEWYQTITSKVVVNTISGSSTHGSLLMFIRTSHPVELNIAMMRVELEYEF